ncbi:MAG: TolC family protein [Bdellovibrionales bacterium]|nr:TolC family protein [Bdellovibrionales bacterium]
MSQPSPLYFKISFRVLLILSFVLGPQASLATKLQPNSGAIQLNEKALLDMALSSSPVLQGIEAQNQLAQLEKSRLDAQYESRLNGEWSYAESREDGLASFIPVFSPERRAGLGLNKRLPVGMNVAVTGFQSQINAGNVINAATRTGATVNLEVDLLKNFFGRIDRNALLEKESAAEKAELEAELGRKGLMMDVRKLYWSLVANQLSLNLSQQLVTSANKQLRDATKRSRAGAADKGDVARSRAQVLSRQSSVYLFQYEKEQLEYQLKKMVPALVDKKFAVSPDGIDDAVRGVLACVQSITKDQKGNPDYSSYYSVINLTQKQFEGQRKQAETTGDWDLKLTSAYQISEVQAASNSSGPEFDGDFQDGYSVGVQLSIPLEGDIHDAELAQKRLVEARFKSEIRNLELQVEETHKQVSKSLILLQEAASALNQNVINLKQSLGTTKRKYRQARISINEMIVEQDQLFSSQLNEIATKLQVIHALYEYFKVFNTHPCPLNEI